MPLGAGTSFLLSQDGLTVYDSANNITWLADANIPVTNRFGLPLCTCGAQPCVNPNGSMNYQSALAWIAAMNGSVCSNRSHETRAREKIPAAGNHNGQRRRLPFRGGHTPVNL